MVWTKDVRFGGLWKWSGRSIRGWVHYGNGLDVRLEAGWAVEMVWTFDKRLGGLWKWSGRSTRGWVSCGNGLDVR